MSSDFTPDDMGELLRALFESLTLDEKNKLLLPLSKFTLAADAAAAQRSITEFIFESALAGLAKRRSFDLNGGEWEAFLAAQDAPPRPLPRMERLLRRPGFFDGSRSNEPPRRIEKLRPDHPIKGFDCGKPEWNRLLLETWRSQEVMLRWGATTYIGMSGDTVVGYYTLAGADVGSKEARGWPTTIQFILLAPLAVDKRWHGQGVGKALLKDAILRTLLAAAILGLPACPLRPFAVHARDPDAVKFYQKFDFGPSPTDPMHLFVRSKDLRRMISER